MLNEEVIPSIQHFNKLNCDYFSGEGLLGMKLRRSLKEVGNTILSTTKLTSPGDMEVEESNKSFSSLSAKVDGLEKLLQAVDAKTSSTSILFGKV